MPTGVFLAFCGYAAFCVGDVLVKAVGPSVSVFELGFFTTIFSVLPAILANRGEQWRRMFAMRHPYLLQIRCLCVLVCSACVMYAFTHIPFSEVYAIGFAAPIFITILSVAFLKEHMTPFRWLFLAIGFCGVLLVVRPGFRVVEVGHIAMMVAALLAAVAAVLLRRISPFEQRITIIGVTALYSVVFNGALMLPTFIAPTPMQWSLFAAIGIINGAGILLIIAATRITPANIVAPIQYSQLVWAILFGALFYREFPDTLAVIGLVVVVVAGTLSVLSEQTRTQWQARILAFRVGQ